MRKVNSVEILLHLGIDLLQQVGEDTERQFSTKLLSCDELRHDVILIKESLDFLFDIWVENDNTDNQAFLTIDIRLNGIIIALSIFRIWYFNPLRLLNSHSIGT
jgi:hypothetical protein